MIAIGPLEYVVIGLCSQTNRGRVYRTTSHFATQPDSRISTTVFVFTE